MKAYNVYPTDGENNVQQAQGAQLPAKITAWSKVKNFLFQEIDQNIEVTLTPKQEKVFQEVHDFWHQDVTFKGIKDFLLQDIEITL